MTMSYDELRRDVTLHLFSGIEDWTALFHEEQVVVDRTMELMAIAYDEAFSDCEYQDSGFGASPGWKNNNPYRKVQTNV